ncbi:hypothetical protein [Leptospira brenneri]|uniref:hypothetical protein n=1 Tax=Leptospira brenneri TaxID=2023182 RepID=UPI000C2B339F|nr:hypothetical protein [Leptospira brenneri]PJZ43833.1 hypothetical protein CH361_18315 [Leptospira brenneri]
MNLDCRIVSPKELSDLQIRQMFLLMEKNYIGVETDTFYNDLYTKTKIFLFSKDKTIHGFTSLKLDSIEWKKKKIQVSYSGDTVLAKEFRGSLSIPIHWGRYMLRISQDQTPLYWLLTSKGFRTYRYLSVFFKDFIPNPNTNNTELKELREYIAIQTFGSDYHSDKGILRRSRNLQTIRDVASDKNYIAKTKDSYIKFFGEHNPNYHQGDEMVCLAKFDKSNIIPFIYRYLISDQNVS